MAKRNEISDITPNEEKFVTDVIRIIREGRDKAYEAVNTSMIDTYWNVGRRIVLEEQNGEVRADFLLELGKGYAFVARQQHITTDVGDFYIDLVFYNYLLKAFLLIDLKTTKISHQDVGQMDMYVRMYDDLKRTEGDNPTIGLILCTETSKDIARYSVLHENPQLFAAKYLTYLPSEEELGREIEKQKEIFQIQQGEK
jgi:hypothetical protein